ncbi:hypothetical protein LTS13_000718 [Exophiala xenobiotica]|nr:hypothetical protein LTS13_000718 [Exophiala xenobiotica]
MGSERDGTVENPINREPDMKHLVQSFLTPSKDQESSQPQAYDRNHGPIQHIDASTHKVTIKPDSSPPTTSTSTSNVVPKGGLDDLDLVLTVDDLRSKFTQHTVTCALQCAGNRRHELRSRVKEVSGVDWGDGAVMNAEWAGPLLRDVLISAGLNEHEDVKKYDGLHVQMECNATKVQDDEWYGSSVPLAVAMDREREVILALDMNGTPLPARHGAPVRSIIPGIIGARSVKWLDTIVISARESQNHYQQHDYKVLPPSATSPERAEELGVWDSTPAMQDNPINSVVAVPANDGDTLTRDSRSRVKIAGYAIPQGKDGPVEKVEVSIDKGKTWVEARLLDEGDENTTHPSNMHKDRLRGKFSWVLWEVEIEVGKDGPRPKEAEGEGEGEGVSVDIWSKATDRGGNTMKEDQPEGDWNLRGVGYNAVQGRTGVRIL